MSHHQQDASASAGANGHSANENDSSSEKFQKVDRGIPPPSRTQSARERLLSRIAASLNTGEAELLIGGPTVQNVDAAGDTIMDETNALAAECVELVRIYCSIPGSDNRKRWLDLLRAAAIEKI